MNECKKTLFVHLDLLSLNQLLGEWAPPSTDVLLSLPNLTAASGLQQIQCSGKFLMENAKEGL